MTSTKDRDSALIKTDCLGRVHLDKERREKLLDAFEGSPLSGTKFAALHGVKYQTFATWVQKRKRERGEYPTDVLEKETAQKLLDSLVELELPAPISKQEAQPHPEGLLVEHPSGLKMTLRDLGQAELAAALLNKLNPASPC